MWVRVYEWMLADEAPPRPEAGSLLRAVGLRLIGALAPAVTTTPDGLTEVVGVNDADPGQRRYALTGVASDVRDVWTSTERGAGSQHSSAELVLTVGAERFQVSFAGHAFQVESGARLTATGHFSLVGEYEWDAFELADTRADWLVTRVVVAPEGNLHLELSHARAG